MALVSYSDSSSSDEDSSECIDNQGTASGTLRRKRNTAMDSSLPSLPPSFYNLYASTLRTAGQDDPSLHAGRQRQTPHVEGNWPTHVYIEWYPLKEESSHLQKLLFTIGGGSSAKDLHVHSLLMSDLGAIQPVHISLSRPIVLLAHQRQSFTDSFSLEISKARIRPFHVHLQGLDWVANQEKTRWFLVLRVKTSTKNELTQLLHISNHVAQNFEQQPLYESPCSTSLPFHQDRSARGRVDRKNASYSKHQIAQLSHDFNVSANLHVSIGWSLTPPPEDSIMRLYGGIDVSQISFAFKADTVKLKIGNGITVFPLEAKVETLNGVIGA